MKKYIRILFLILCALVFKANAQDSHLSQYFNVPLFVNPALAGNNIQNMRIAADYRSQWSSSGSPFKTQTIALDKNVNRVGFGVIISKNSAGKDGFNKLSLLGGLSYHVKFGDDNKHEITAGFQVGLLQKSFDPSKLSFENQYSYDVGYDPNASNGETFANTKVSRPDVNLGITYYLGQGNPEIKLKPFAGVAFSHVNKPKESFIELNNVTPVKTTLHSGMGIVCSKKLELKPMILYMKQDQFSQLNVGIVSEFALENTNTIKFGVFHRNKDAMIVYAGYQINKVMLGTSYDVNTSAYNKASNGNGALEISLVYTPQGKQAGKKIKKPEPKTIKPINKKQLPEPKLKRPDFYSSVTPLDTKSIEQKPVILRPVKPTGQVIAKIKLPKNAEQDLALHEKVNQVSAEKIKVEPKNEPVVLPTDKQIKAEPKTDIAESNVTINAASKENTTYSTPVLKPDVKPAPVKEQVAVISTPSLLPSSDLSNAEFERLDYVLFTPYTTKYDLNNKFDVVENVIDFLYKYPSSKILLSGNTDDVEQRLKPALGYLRADEVKNYMVNKGVDALRIHLLNAKNLNPLGNGTSESPIDLNRRVDIFLVK